MSLPADGLIRLSTDATLSRRCARLRGVLRPAEWTEIPRGVTPCKHAKRGLILGTLRAVTFCASARCTLRAQLAAGTVPSRAESDASLDLAGELAGHLGQVQKPAPEDVAAVADGLCGCEDLAEHLRALRDEIALPLVAEVGQALPVSEQQQFLETALIVLSLEAHGLVAHTAVYSGPHGRMGAAVLHRGRARLCRPEAALVHGFVEAGLRTIDPTVAEIARELRSIDAAKVFVNLRPLPARAVAGLARRDESPIERLFSVSLRGQGAADAPSDESKT